MLKKLSSETQGLEGAIVDHAIWLIRNAWDDRKTARKYKSDRFRISAQQKAREAGYLMDMIREFQQ